MNFGGYNPLKQNWDSLNPFKRPEADNSEGEAAAAYQAMIDKKKIESEDAINAVFDQFGQEDYDAVSDARTGFENIELKDQYNDALKELEYALARGGRKGSTNLKRKADATKEWKKQQILSGRRAAGDVKTYKDQIKDARRDMHGLNIANADPAMMADQAARNAGLLSAPATYEPLVDVFSSITEGLATQREIDDRRNLMNTYRGYTA
jgi:hypothetical protein